MELQNIVEIKEYENKLKRELKEVKNKKSKKPDSIQYKAACLSTFKKSAIYHIHAFWIKLVVFVLLNYLFLEAEDRLGYIEIIIINVFSSFWDILFSRLIIANYNKKNKKYFDKEKQTKIALKKVKEEYKKALFEIDFEKYSKLNVNELNALNKEQKEILKDYIKLSKTEEGKFFISVKNTVKESENLVNLVNF